MNKEKMSLANVQGKLSRIEMRKIMAGSDIYGCKSCTKNADCASGVCIHYAGSGPCGDGSYC